MPTTKRLVCLLMLALAFGVVVGFFKGNETDLRGGLGNLSAPWILVALLPAVWAGGPLRGALTGLASTLAALVGFYAALTVVLAGHLGDGGYLLELLTEVRANRIYFLAGLVTGPVFGVFGAWLGRRHRQWVGVVAGAIVTAEIAVVGAVQGHQLLPRPLYFAWGVDSWTPYVAECIAGIALLAISVARGYHTTTRNRHRPVSK